MKVMIQARLSFPHLFEPYTNDQTQKPKYSAMLLIPKTDTVTIQKIQQAQQAVWDGEKQGKLKGISAPRMPLRDGDEPDTQGKDHPDRHGYMFLNASSLRPPALVDQQVNKVTDQNLFYPGCWVNVQVALFAYNNRAVGIAAGLNAVQFARDGERLDSMDAPEDIFQPTTTAAGGSPWGASREDSPAFGGLLD